MQLFTQSNYVMNAMCSATNITKQGEFEKIGLVMCNPLNTSFMQIRGNDLFLLSSVSA